MAQEPDSVMPGQIATIPLAIALPAGVEGEVRYRLMAAPGIRLLMDSTGVLPAARGGPVPLAVTFRVPREQPIGSLVVATAELSGGAGHRERVELRVRVRAQRRLEVAMDQSPPAIAPGAAGELGYVLRNQGNAPDTVAVHVELGAGWTGSPEYETIVLRAGEELRRTVRIRPPHDVTPGEQRHVHLRVLASSGDVVRTAMVRVAAPEDVVGGLAHVPGSVFVGTGALGSGGGVSGGDLALALSASGPIGGGTEMSISAVRHPDGAPPPGLWPYMSGPRFRLALRRSGMEVAVGDVTAAGGLILRQFTQGTGASAHWARGGHEGELLLARTGVDASGHALLYRHQVHSSLGELGLQLSDMEPGSLFGGRSQMGTLTLERGELLRGRLRAELGAYRLLHEDGAESVGPAAGLEYSTSRGSSSLWVRARHAPALTPGISGVEDELFLGGSVPLVGGLGADGWAFLQSLPSPGDDASRVARGGYVGGRLTAAGSTFRLGVDQRHTSPPDSLAGERRAALSAAVQTGLGPLSLGAGAEVGRLERTDGSEGKIRQLRADASWISGSSHLWLATTYADQGMGNGEPRASVGWAWQPAPLRLEGGFATPLAGPAWRSRAHLWSSLNVKVARGLELVIGSEHQPWRLESPWRISLGVRRAINMPLPMPSVPVSSGIVFEDANGNGRWDPGEQGVAGVVLHRGGIRVETDERGRFAIRAGASDGTLRLDASSLPAGLVLPPDVLLRSVGRVEIPVIRPARLHLRLRLVERPSEQMISSRPKPQPTWSHASGAVVTLTGADGRVRRAAAGPEGNAVFSSVPAGTYTVLIQGAPSLSRFVTPLELEVELAPGEDLVRDVELEFRPRPVRMGGFIGGAGQPH